MTGRRTADQLRGYDWGAIDPEPYVHVFSAYGMTTEPLVE
jgi:hypothetical protein